MENGADLKEPAKVAENLGKNRARKVDKISRRIFPLAFLIFNIIYWILYTMPSEEEV